MLSSFLLTLWQRCGAFFSKSDADRVVTADVEVCPLLDLLNLFWGWDLGELDMTPCSIHAPDIRKRSRD